MPAASRQWGGGWSPLSGASVAYGCRAPKPQRAVMEAATGAIGFAAGASKRGHRVDASHHIPIVRQGPTRPSAPGSPAAAHHRRPPSRCQPLPISRSICGRAYSSWGRPASGQASCAHGSPGCRPCSDLPIRSLGRRCRQPCRNRVDPPLSPAVEACPARGARGPGLCIWRPLPSRERGSPGGTPLDRARPRPG